MEQNGINLTLKKIRENEEKMLEFAFFEASEDKDRQATINAWESLDSEGWD
jgi:hypothetical protein